MTIREKLAKLTRLYKKKAVAIAAGIDPVTLRSIMVGKREPSLKVVKALARALGVDAGWLISDLQGWPPVRVAEPGDLGADIGESAKAEPAGAVVAG